LFLGKYQQQPEGVAIGRYGVRADVSLTHKPIGKEAFQQSR
jgi:hypothetical protein